MNITRFIRQICIAAIGSLLALICLLFLVWSQFRPTHRTHATINDHTILEIDLAGKQLVEIMPPMSLGRENHYYIDLKLLKKAISQATMDKRIEAIYIKLSYLQAGWAVLEEIREALLAFKRQGKIIVAYGDSYTHKSYYLASLADEVVLNPSGFLQFQGLSATTYFFKNLLDNISVKPVIIRAGDYKSAVEPYCLDKMSKESRQQTNEYLSFIYEHFLKGISLSRDISVADLKQFARDLSAIMPHDALHRALITKVDYEDEARNLLSERIGKSAGIAHPSFLSYRNYFSANKEAVDVKVAVVVVEGEIIPGRSSFGYIGARDFVKTIQAIQENASIKAVVLRINSPGGSALASDIMWKAIEELKKSKQVVASLSSQAASGGYYIASPCHYIFAQPTTITGSIGAFGLYLDPTQLLQKIGIEQDVVKTAPSADFLNPRLQGTEAELKFCHKMIQQCYDDFLHKVSQGRNLHLEQVEKLASGRVYTGQAALTHELVDALGDLDAAIQKAAALAALNEKYSVYYFPRVKTRWEQLWDYMDITTIRHTTLLKDLLQEYPILSHLQMVRKRQGVQTLLPYVVDVA